MKTWVARSICYGAVASLAAAALAFVRPLPTRIPVALLKEQARGGWRESVDSVARGETLGEVFQRGGLAGGAALEAVRTARIDPRRVRAGTRVTFGGLPADSAPRTITLRLAVDRLLRLTRTDSGWDAREDTLAWTTDTLVVHGDISSTLYAALDAGAVNLPREARTELAWDVADIFDWRIDMSRDLQTGDRFSVLVERQRGPEGTVRIGRILAAVFANAGSTIQAVRYERSGDRARYYDQDGRSLEANFLTAPLSFRRISSVFGLRKHPILGIWRKHTGTDYAAEAGTPVRAIGDGVVVAAGVRGGYGNAIDVRHANGFVSRYGHLRAFARGVHAGTRVSMGQTIGFVGMTGLATAPHLHFEILVGGVQRNPRSALSRTGGTPLPDVERPRFETFKTRYLGLLSGTASLGN